MHISAQKQMRGFTLIELLLVVSLIAVLSSFLIPGFSGYISNQNIRQAQELLKSDLRTTQNKALTGVGASDPLVAYWGLKISSENAVNYSFFKSSDNQAVDCTNAVLEETSTTMGGDVVIKGANGVCIFFSLRNGDATITGIGGDTISVGYADEAACYGVQINSAGLIRGVVIAC